MRLQPFDRIVETKSAQNNSSANHSAQNLGGLGNILQNAGGLGNLKNLLPLVDTLKNSDIFGDKQKKATNFESEKNLQGQNFDFTKASGQTNQSQGATSGERITNSESKNVDSMSPSFPLDNSQLALSNFLSPASNTTKNAHTNGGHQALQNNRQALLKQMQLHEQLRNQIKN